MDDTELENVEILLKFEGGYSSRWAACVKCDILNFFFNFLNMKVTITEAWKLEKNSNILLPRETTSQKPRWVLNIYNI